MYVDIIVSYPDAQVCSALCVDGTVMYILVAGLGLDSSVGFGLSTSKIVS